ncbi:hypothetical protein ABZ070_31085 [Streptomyces sp. NPDC006283]|uniref:hypothetical protein n=1 Tax=Streptomyces sp. NPDC006283 TaxID=3156741 RepID=UPI0033AECF7A
MTLASRMSGPTLGPGRQKQVVQAGGAKHQGVDAVAQTPVALLGAYWLELLLVEERSLSCSGWGSGPHYESDEWSVEQHHP